MAKEDFVAAHLILVPTPLGNLGDMTGRGVDALRDCDLVACEDTRRTGGLLVHLGIEKPLMRFDDHASAEARDRIILVGRSMGASVGLLALAALEREGRGPLGGIIWEGAPASSRDFAERLVRGPEDRFWHPWLAPLIGDLASRLAALEGRYDRNGTDLLRQTAGAPLGTPSLCFIASQDRLAPPAVQREMAARFRTTRTISVPTWHLHCSESLGPAYTEALRAAVGSWLTRR